MPVPTGFGNGCSVPAFVAVELHEHVVPGSRYSGRHLLPAIPEATQYPRRGRRNFGTQATRTGVCPSAEVSDAYGAPLVVADADQALMRNTYFLVPES